MEASWPNAFFVHIVVDRFNHRRGTTEIDVHIAILQVVGLYVICDVALMGPVTVCLLYTSDAADE